MSLLLDALKKAAEQKAQKSKSESSPERTSDETLLEAAADDAARLADDDLVKRPHLHVDAVRHPLADGEPHHKRAGRSPSRSGPDQATFRYACSRMMAARSFSKARLG